MKAAAPALAVCLLAVGAVAADESDWRTSLTKSPPDFLPPLRPVVTDYQFGWGKLTAAHGTLDFSIPAPGVRRMDLTGQTSGVARVLWRMDARAFSICDATTLTPIRLRQAEWLRKGTTLVAQEFTPLDVLRSRGKIQGDLAPEFFTDAPLAEIAMEKLTHAKTKRVKFPGLYDLHSAFLYVRGQPLAQGDVIRVVVYQDNWPYLATLRVAGRESLMVAAGTFPAIKLELSLQYINKTLGLEAHTKFKRAVGWLSDDADRLILKIQADVFVGSVWTELERVSR